MRGANEGKATEVASAGGGEDPGKDREAKGRGAGARREGKVRGDKEERQWGTTEVRGGKEVGAGGREGGRNGRGEEKKNGEKMKEGAHVEGWGGGRKN